MDDEELLDAPEGYSEMIEEIARMTPDELVTVLADVSYLVREHEFEDESEATTVAMRAYVLGVLHGQAGAADGVDVIVPITPEQAAGITTGLFGPGTTIALTVVRDN